MYREKYGGIGMKVWEMQEDKEYVMVKNKTFKMRLKGGAWEYYHARFGEWKYSTERINVLKDYDFEEIVDTNSHWKPKEKELFLTINDGFNGTYLFERGVEDETVSNIFHVDDKKKVECLALEFKIKSVLLNWRRIHDDIELDYNDGKWCILYWSGIYLTKTRSKTSSVFGYFSSREEAQKFYDYMKDDIDRYFKMRKALKF